MSTKDDFYMEINIEWRLLDQDSKEWNYHRVLYAYLNPANDRILYIGMAYHRTVRQRFKDKDKEALFDFLRKELRVHTLKVLVGDLIMEGRLTRQLLSDVESLLIKRLMPIGNLMCRTSRISRPGIRLECSEHWPHKRARFIDIG